jgi:hypothetical protein
MILLGLLGLESSKVWPHYDLDNYLTGDSAVLFLGVGLKDVWDLLLLVDDSLELFSPDLFMNDLETGSGLFFFELAKVFICSTSSSSSSQLSLLVASFKNWCSVMRYSY